MNSFRALDWRKGRLALAVIVGLVSGVCGVPSVALESSPSNSHEWEQFQSTDLRFRIRFPSVASSSEAVRRTWIGDVKEHQFVAEQLGAEFIVQVRELPRAARWFVSDSFVLDRVRSGFFEDGERPKLLDVPITRAGFEGRHLRYEDPKRDGGEWVEDALIFLTADHLYFVVVARNGSPVGGLPIDSFFRSFELW